MVEQLDEDTRQQIVDDEQLKILRMCYFFAAGVTAFAGLFGLLYAFLGFTMFSHLPQESGQPGPPVEFFKSIGQLFGIFGAVFTLAMMTIAFLQFLTAQRLKQRRSRVFCMVVAGIACFAIPYGTILGVCTFIVLGRPSVEKLFEK